MRGSAVILATSLAIIACGGGRPAPSAVEISTVATEFRYQPARWSVSPGAEVTVTLDNQGTVEHTFVVLAVGERVATTAEIDPGDVLFEVGAEGGQVTEAAFTAPSRTGTYQVICTVPGHLEAGMRATLEVSG